MVLVSRRYHSLQSRIDFFSLLILLASFSLAKVVVLPENDGNSFQIRVGPSASNVTTEELCLEAVERRAMKLMTKKCSNYSVAQKFKINSNGYIETKQYTEKCLSVHSSHASNVKFITCNTNESKILTHLRWIFSSDETIRPLADARNALKLNGRKEIVEGLFAHKTGPTTDADKFRQFHFVTSGIFTLHDFQSGETTSPPSKSTFVFPSYGYYNLFTDETVDVKVQMWGAGGGGCYTSPTRGSAGGYTEANITLVKGSNYTLIIGQGGEGCGTNSSKGGFPDGGSSVINDQHLNAGAGGGGSTRFGNFIPIEKANDNSTKYLLIAGAGGGGSDYISLRGTVDGRGGGLIGGDGGGFNSEGSPGKGASQSSAGFGDLIGYQGSGENWKKYKASNGYGAGGGGGYFGGAGAAGFYGQGGGGSGYICESCDGFTMKGCGEKSCNYYDSRVKDRPLKFTGMGGLISRGKEGSRGGSGAIIITIL